MAVEENVRQIIDILQNEGFGAIAGELLTEIELGKIVEKPVNPELDHYDFEYETVIVREPISDNDQLAAAIAFLRHRLVDPVRAFAEAEKITERFGGPFRIEFVGTEEERKPKAFSIRDIGDSSLVEEFDRFLDRLPTIVPPEVSRDI